MPRSRRPATNGADKRGLRPSGVHHDRAFLLVGPIDRLPLPGWCLRSVGVNTDLAPVADVERVPGSGPLGLVMVSSARYPNLTGPLPAVMSPITYQRELPLALRGSPVVTISDDLQKPAVAGESAPARHAINAGLDLLMYAGTEQGSAEAYITLLDEARVGLVSKARIEAAYAAIEALKHVAA